jgi:ElaB/YqjD/DUF883 family membrane-anchored ribosome-binding protein
MEYPDIQQHVGDLKDDLSKLRNDLVDIVRTMMEAGKVEAGEARERLEAKARAQLDMLTQTMSTTRDRGQVLAEKMTRQIEDNPVKSVIIALGLGLAVGLFVSRR